MHTSHTGPHLFAGFTFIGQFIDHDITLDNTPLELQQADPDATVNFRTPRYDLDSVYGRGPAHEPQFYDPADRDKLLVTPNVNGVEDMARDGNGRAIIPEPRNDENLIIVQLHKAVAKFHNRIVDYARAQGIRREWVFETARRLTRWHYQWAVIHDFLPRFVGDGLVGPNGTVYKEVAGKPPVINLNYYRPTNRDGRPFMPVEFAVAAYRFGHSIIRPFYVINQRLGRAASPVFGPAAASTSTVAARSRPTWSSSGRTSFPSIRTSRPASRARSTRSCRSRSPAFPGRSSRLRTRRSTWPYATRSAESTSAYHRVSRSRRRCAPPSCPTRRSGSATIRGGAARRRCGSTSCKEAELPPYNGERLGPVGGRIMAEVLVGLLQRDPNSYLYLDAGLETCPADRAGDGPVHLRRPTQIRWRCLRVAVTGRLSPPQAITVPPQGFWLLSWAP